MTPSVDPLPVARPARAPRRLSKPLRVLAGATLGVPAAMVLATSAFIGTQCYRPSVDGAKGAAVASVDHDPADGRPEALTYLTLPEWFIVYSADEYARFVERESPSDYPYLRSIAQFWQYYRFVCRATRSAYSFDSRPHVMLGTIGLSFTVELALKGLYENTVGRASAWLGTHETPEDAFGARTAAEYGTFMHSVPWYQFDFFGRLRHLWTDVPLFGARLVRKLERRVALSAEYGLKGVYGWLLGAATQSAYGAQDLTIQVRVDNALESIFHDPRIEKVQSVGAQAYVVRLPRYEAFTHAMLSLLEAQVRVLDIAGNDEILLTALAPSSLDEQTLGRNRVVARLPILTEPSRQRLALRVPVTELHQLVPTLRAAGATIEHLYDY